MSAEVPTPNAEKPPARSRVSNRGQMLLFVALTLILTVATVWGGRIWLRNSESLVFAAGDANGVEARFAEKLASVLNNNPSKLRLKIVTNPDSGKALAQFDRRQADLAVLRTDTKVPPRARGAGHPRARRSAAAQPSQQKDQVACGAEEKEDRGFGRRRPQRGVRPQNAGNFR